MMGKKENEKTTKERREKPGGTFLNAKALKRGAHARYWTRDLMALLENAMPRRRLGARRRANASPRSQEVV